MKSNTINLSTPMGGFHTKLSQLCRIGLGMGALLLLSSSGVMAQRIKVVVDGAQVRFDGMGPVQKEGHTLVPLRGVLETLGAEVEWRPESQMIIASTASKSIRMHLGDMEAIVNGKTIPLDVPAQAFSGHTMVPLRFISEALGDDVRWDDVSRTVIIVTADRKAIDRTDHAERADLRREERRHMRHLADPTPKDNPR